MSNTSFTPKDIKAVKAKYPNVPLLKLETGKARMNKNKKQPTYYIPFSMRNITGKFMPLNLKFVRQIIASSAKIPFGVEEDQAKDLRISYRRLDASDLEKTDYQEESQREVLLKSNEEMIDALNIIADEYYSLLEREVFKYKGDKFKLTKKQRDTIYCFRQSERKAGDGEEGDENGMIPLPAPIFRIKLEADPETKKIGRKTEKGHKYVVFDIKKTARLDAENKKKGVKNPTKPVIAKINVGNTITDLTIKNAKHFITYMSLTGGTIYFDSICISNQGVSILCKFTDLHVSHHRVLKQDGLNMEEISENVGFGANNLEEDLDVVVDEPEEGESTKPDTKKKTGKPAGKTKNSKALSKALDNDEDGEQNLDDEEPAENDGGDEETEQQVDDPDEIQKKSDAEAEAEGDAEEGDAAEGDAEETEEAEKPSKKPAAKPAAKPTKKTEAPKKPAAKPPAKSTKVTKAVKKPEPEPEPEAEADVEENNVEEEPTEPEENNAETETADAEEETAEQDADAEETENAENNEEKDETENAEADENNEEETKKETKAKTVKPGTKGASLKAGARKK